MSDPQLPPTASSVPPNAKGIRNVPTRYWVGLIMALTTMMMSGKAYFSPNEPSARKSYDLLAKALEAEAKSNAQNHDDLVALRAYLDGYIKSREAPHPLAIENKPVPVGLDPHAAITHSQPQTLSVVQVMPIEKATEPPPVGVVAPPRFTAPAYKAVTQKDDL